MTDYIAKALDSLDEISSRQFEATAERRYRRKDGLREFASVFHEVASERDGLNVVEARFRLEQALRTFGESEPQRVSEAEAPFWRHCARRAGRAESTTLATLPQDSASLPLPTRRRTLPLRSLQVVATRTASNA